MNRNIVLCGVGGQGTVLASKLLSSAAMAKGLPVMSAETIGMAQRGGSVFSHVRMGEGIWSPMIAQGTADLVIGFEPGEAVRLLPSLKPGAAMVAADRAVVPVTSMLAGPAYSAGPMLDFLRSRVERLLVVDAGAAFRETGSAKALNIVLLGAALASGSLGLEEEDLRQAILRVVPQKFHALNFRALEYGMALR